MLVLDPDVHVAAIPDLDVDAEGKTAATSSLDGTVRIWAAGRARSAHDAATAWCGALGTAYAVAIVLRRVRSLRPGDE